MHSLYPSLARAVETGPTAKFVTDFRSCPHGRIQMVETFCPPGDVKYSSRPELTLTRTVNAEKPGAIRAKGGLQVYRSGDFELAPPASPDSWRSDGAATFTNLALPVAELEAISGTSLKDLGVLHEKTFRCHAVVRILVLLQAETYSVR